MSPAEGALEQLLLLELVAAGAAGGRARRFRATRAAEREAPEQHRPETCSQDTPGAHVLRFFLNPDHGRAVVVLVDGRAQVHVRQRIVLLDPHYGDVVAAELL